MNRAKYMGDARYERVLERMDLLGIMDVSTTRQARNGTIVWKLPIKNNHRPTSLIEVASFKTGYVRNQNSGYSNYQLNKRYFVDEYFKDYDWVDGKQKWNGKYRRFKSKSCHLIPIEIDRLEYLISYCLKNYYIKRANQVVEGKYVSQWYHDWSLERANKSDRVYELESQVNCGDKRIIDLKAKLKKVTSECNTAYDCGLSDGETKANETYSENTGAMARINDMEEKLDAMTEARDYYLNKTHSLENKLDEETWEFLQDKIRSLESKLERIQKIADTK